MRQANPGVSDDDLVDEVSIETGKPPSAVRKALGLNESKLNEFQSQSFGERALGVAGDIFGLNGRGTSVFDSNPPEKNNEDISFQEQQARKAQAPKTTAAAAKILKSAEGCDNLGL